MRITKFIFPIVFLLLSISIMESGSYLKKIGKNDVPVLLNEIENNVIEDDWTEAQNKVMETRKKFNKITKIIQFSVERDELVDFKFHLALLEGYISTHDLENSIAQISLLNEYWMELGR